MKKFARIMALVLVAAMLCVMLVACGAKPAEDPADAKAALEENGYTAMHYSGILLEAVSGAFGDGVTDIVMGHNKVDGEEEIVTIVWYEDEEAAEKAYETLAEEEDEEDVVLGHSGKMIWAGTENAVKAAS